MIAWNLPRMWASANLRTKDWRQCSIILRTIRQNYDLPLCDITNIINNTIITSVSKRTKESSGCNQGQMGLDQSSKGGKKWGRYCLREFWYEFDKSKGWEQTRFVGFIFAWFFSWTPLTCRILYVHVPCCFSWTAIKLPPDGCQVCCINDGEMQSANSYFLSYSKHWGIQQRARLNTWVEFPERATGMPYLLPLRRQANERARPASILSMWPSVTPGADGRKTSSGFCCLGFLGGSLEIQYSAQKVSLQLYGCYRSSSYGLTF